MKKVDLIFVLAIAFALFVCVSGVVSAKMIHVPDDYAKIQWAVDNASIGDTIIVRDGTYTDNVGVPKSLMIRSISGNPDNTIGPAKIEAMLEMAIPLGDISHSNSSQIYWAERDSVLKANLDGTGLTTFIIGGYPTDVAIDPLSGKVYWTDNGFDTISRANFNGSDTEVIYSSSDPFSNPRGIASFVVKSVPVILAHGYYGKPAHLTKMKSWLEKDNFSVYIVNYTHGKVANGDIKKYANALDSEIERIKKETGAKKVDIVAHSMGGLVSRYYIEKGGGANNVRKLIVLGTPNHGSELFKLRYIPLLELFMKLFCHDFKGVGEAGKQMTPGYTFLDELGYAGRANYYTIAGTDDWWLTTLILKGDDDHLVRVVSVELDEVPNHYEYYLDHGELIRNKALYNDTIKSILLDKPITKQSYVKFKTQQAHSTIQETPMIFGKINPGEEKSHEILISSTDELSICLLWLEGDLNLTLTTPNGTLINPSFAVNDTNITYYSDEDLTIEGYDIKTSESGIWSVNVTAVNISGEEDYSIITFLDTNIILSLSLQKYQYDPNEPIKITANLTYGSEAITDASVTAKIQKPDSTIENITLFDDGLHGDNQTNDGIYANEYTNTATWGTYDITVTASGEINEEPFERETFACVWVELYPDLTLNTSDISFSNDAPLTGENITINATIHNIGEADANNASILFYDGEPASGEKIGEDVVNVSVSATANASVSWLAKTGVHEIYVLISPYNEFLEKNYTNDQAFKAITVAIANVSFDTGSPENPYPSIFGTHNGTLKPNQTITVNNLYTYPCSGTGGHTEYARIWNSLLDVNATWNGYKGDWHNISFNKSFKLVADETYNYTIRTGSYPQIHHTSALPTANGWINCTEFVDANWRRYNNWIPAIRLE